MATRKGSWSAIWQVTVVMLIFGVCMWLMKLLVILSVGISGFVLGCVWMAHAAALRYRDYEE